MSKSALGIKTKEIWLEEFEKGLVIPFDKIMKRYVELCETFRRRINNGDKLRVEWLEEYNEILKYIKGEIE